jgi:ribonuclease G
MKNELFVNVGPRETRVAVRESDQITELHIERPKERGVVGGIYKGRVTRVLPGMQAAFVDMGLERAGFLYVADYRDLDDVDLDDEDGPPQRRRGGLAQRGGGPQIQDLLQEGKEVTVQVSKEPLGTKGARITSRISIAGRHLVLMPWVSRVGVSRRIGGDKERRRLRQLVEKLRPEGLGFIVRTVSHGVTEADLRADIDYLASQWERVQKRMKEAEAPALIYEEPLLHLRVLRDMTTRDTKQIVVDDPVAYGEMQEFSNRFMANPRPRIVHYTGSDPLFDSYRIESQIEDGLARKVWLKSGGYLIFDQSEALTAIDVNTGRFVGGKSRNLEETILKTNLEAVREIVHQLRFRNIGGLIILDLIDMEISSNREKVYRALLDALREDKAKVNILKISELGLIEMTRKRTRENLVQQLCEACPNCEGKGYLSSATSMVQRIFRELPKAVRHVREDLVLLQTSPDVAELLAGEDADALEKVERKIGRLIAVRPNPNFHREMFEVGPAPDEPEFAELRPLAKEFAEESARAEVAAFEPAGVEPEELDLHEHSEACEHEHEFADKPDLDEADVPEPEPEHADDPERTP